MKRTTLSVLLGILVLGLSLGILAAVPSIRNLQPFRDSTGYIATYNTAGDIDESSAFFQELGPMDGAAPLATRPTRRSASTSRMSAGAFSQVEEKIHSSRRLTAPTVPTPKREMPPDTACCSITV